jgi:UDP-glucose 4-epimerase
MSDDLSGKSVLITGGAGFLGSNLARRLVSNGARVKIFDKPGKDLKIISDIKNKIEIVENLYEGLWNVDLIFHLAWQTDLKKSMIQPSEDAKNDLICLLGILEFCRKNSSETKIVFASASTVVGLVDEPLGDESVDEKPESVYEINKLLGERYLKMYHKNYGLKTTSLRLSNVFGEGQRIDNPNRGVLNFMIGRALRGEELSVYGSGEFIRDYCYVQNYVDAFIAAASTEKTNGEIYVLGSGEGRSFNDVVNKIKDIFESKKGGKREVQITHVPFPDEENKINKRNFVADYDKFKEATGWSPKVGFNEGLKRTIEFYMDESGRNIESEYNGKRVLITGGAGFIGSNLAHRLVELGASVSVFDLMESNPEVGIHFNANNLEGIRDKIELIRGDIRNFNEISEAIKGKDVIFHCAAHTSHPKSMKHPEISLDITCRGSINVLEAIRKFNQGVKIVYLGTSSQIGKKKRDLINEDHSEFPRDIYSANKMAAEKYHLIYNSAHGINSVVLRFGNLFGPRAAIHSPDYGFVNYFMGLALQDKDITIYEPGDQIRNVTFVGDVVDAILKAGMLDDCMGEVIFATGKSNYTIKEIAEGIVRVVGRGRVKYIPWPEERKAMEVGDVLIDNSKSKRLLGWEAKTDLDEGLEKTKEYYSSRVDKYLI